MASPVVAFSVSSPVSDSEPTAPDFDSFYQFKVRQYGDFAKTLLISTTFAEWITLCKVLDPVNSQTIYDIGF
jgi:hypothetical protein